MIKMFNKIFNILKILMVLLGLALTLYILIFMYQRLEKNPFGESFFEFFGVLLPFILTLIMFTVNIALKQKNVTGNTFYNASCVIALIAIIYFGYRALMDHNMVFLSKDGYGINFNYFADQITQIKVLLYIMVVANIFLIIEGKLNKKKELVFEE